jgi:hypothetical protein
MDGRWTTSFEWDGAGEHEQDFDDGTRLVIRSMYDGEYLYLLLDLIADRYDESTGRAFVCFDTDHDGGLQDSRDYCFMGALEGVQKTYQGKDSVGIDFDFLETKGPGDFMVLGSMSESPYSSSSHPVYEFRIPIDFLGYSEEYGFYAIVLDSGSSYAVPDNFIRSPIPIPSPSEWGLLIQDTDLVFDVKPVLSNGEIQLISVDGESSSLSFLVSMHEDGELRVTLPRELIDSRIVDEDIEFTVMINVEEEVQYEELEKTSAERVLKIPVIHDAFVVEIIGTQALDEAIVVPEFAFTIIVASLGIGVMIAVMRFGGLAAQ